MTPPSPRQPEPGRPVDDALQLISIHAQRTGVRIAVAESLTSGALASRIGAGERASEWFAGGIVAYQVRTKHDVLGVPEDIDPCSADCAELLAVGVRRLTDADDVTASALGIGGHAPGTVFLGWSSNGSKGHRLLRLDGGPDRVLDATVTAAVELLADLVSNVPPREAG